MRTQPWPLFQTPQSSISRHSSSAAHAELHPPPLSSHPLSWPSIPSPKLKTQKLPHLSPSPSLPTANQTSATDFSSWSPLEAVLSASLWRLSHSRSTLLLRFIVISSDWWQWAAGCSQALHMNVSMDAGVTFLIIQMWSCDQHFLWGKVPSPGDNTKGLQSRVTLNLLHLVSYQSFPRPTVPVIPFALRAAATLSHPGTTEMPVYYMVL